MSPEYLKRSNFNKQFLKTSPPFDNVNNLNLSNPDNKQFFANTEYLAGYHDAEREYCTGKAFTDKEADAECFRNILKPYMTIPAPTIKSIIASKLPDGVKQVIKRFIRKSAGGSI